MHICNKFIFYRINSSLYYTYYCNTVIDKFMETSCVNSLESNQKKILLIFIFNHTCTCTYILYIYIILLGIAHVLLYLYVLTTRSHARTLLTLHTLSNTLHIINVLRGLFMRKIFLFFLQKKLYFPHRRVASAYSYESLHNLRRT